MSAFSLRPVSDSPSPSPPRDRTSPSSTAKSSATLPSQSSFSSVQSVSPSAPRLRRPMSPGSLRDVDISSNVGMTPRIYPPPHSGHELMALFPPPPPPFTESTANYFQRQERAFFAQAGKEVLRIRVELDFNDDDMVVDSDNREQKLPRPSQAIPRPWPTGQPQLLPHASHHASPAAPSYSTQLSRPLPRVVSTTPPFANQSQSQSQQHSLPPPNIHTPGLHHPGVPLRTHAQEGVSAQQIQIQTKLGDPHSHQQQHMSGGGGGETAQSEPRHDDPDESWRRPIPHAERRRAGKHTKRVIVKS